MASLLSQHQDAVKRLAEVRGLGVDSAQQIIADVGPTAATFPSQKCLSSWVGACPVDDETAGVNYSHRSPKGNRHMRRLLNRKRLTNTPVRQAESVLKCPDDRKNRVVSAQATYPCGSSAVGGRVCEQRYAAERILPESRFELQHTGSPSKETALEEKA